MNDDTLLARWLEGSLTEAELRRLEQSPEYATLQRMKSNFAMLQSPRTNDTQVLEHILAQPKTPVRKIPLYRRSWMAIAASVVILLGVAVYFAMPREFAAGNGKTLAFALPDDSGVWLNAGSHAQYSRWDWVNNRTIRLEGEAYFKVAKGKKFTVSTQLGTVSVLGTQFNVKAREDRFDVMCYEGKVRVNAAGQSVTLLPGQKISFVGDDAKGLLPTRSVSPEWTHKELSFDDETLAAVLSELGRSYDVRIRTSAQSSQLFSGSVPGNDLEAALKIVASAYHLEVQRLGDAIVLNPVP